jgi:hypothetical protein
MYKQFFAGLTIFALGSVQALAHTTVIAELGTAPLLGTSVSTADLRSRVAHNEGTLSAAAVKAGLTHGEYAQFRAAIDSSHLAWVTLPRHLDVMTWQANGIVYALHDVRVPAQTHGWEVDIPRGHQIIAVYMPAKCGNLSVVRRAVPVIARRPQPKRVLALHAAELPPQAVPVADVPPVPVAPVAVAVIPPAPAPAAVAEAEFPPAPAAVKGRFNVLPLLFGLAALVGATSGGGNNNGGNLPPLAACP